MYKVLLDSDKYLLSYSTLINPIERDVHHLMSQISNAIKQCFSVLSTVFEHDMVVSSRQKNFRARDAVILPPVS